MVDETISTAAKIIEVLKVGGPYAIMIVEGFVIWKLWKTNEELHKKLEKK